jgi:hypothetical protein
VSAHGPRFSGGYQFPRTDSAALRHGEPILRERGLCGPWQAELQLLPMLGGMPDQFAVTLTWGGLTAPSSGSLQALIEGEDRARRADTPLFRRRRDG